MTSKEKVQHIIKLQKKLNKLNITYTAFRVTLKNPDAIMSLEAQKCRDKMAKIEEELHDYLPDD